METFETIGDRYDYWHLSVSGRLQQATVLGEIGDLHAVGYTSVRRVEPTLAGPAALLKSLPFMILRAGFRPQA